MKTLASAIITFSAKKTVFKTVTEPSSPAVNEDFTVIIYAPESYTLESPYFGITSEKTTETTAKKLTELVNIASPSAEYPVANLTSITATNGIVNESTRTVEFSPGQSVSDLVTVVNSELKTDYKDFLGSARAAYTTYLGQKWNHSGFAFAGDVFLFAKSDVDNHYEKITISISDSSESTSKSISIEGFPLRQMSVGYGGIYANFIVYPRTDDITIKTDVGTATLWKNDSILKEAESITFSGKEASAQYFINELVKFKGYFFDEFNNEVTPSFSVKNGKLIASQDCWGVGFLSYRTDGSIYDYFSEVANIPGGGVIESIGNVFAFDNKQKGLAASYKIPQHDTGANDREDFIVVYRDVIVQGDTEFEMPNDGTFPQSNNYLSPYDTALEADKPDKNEAYAVAQDVRHVVFVQNGFLNDDKLRPFYHKPIVGSTWAGVKWKIKDNIPTEATSEINQDLIDTLNARKAELIIEYNIV